MSGRGPILVGILAISGVVAWLVMRTDSANPTPATGSGGLTPSGSARGPIAAPEGPSLPGGSGSNPRPELVPQGPTTDDVFSEEDRDDTWATKAEAEIATRWKRIRGGKLESTECRRTQCKLLVTGSEADVSQAIADLEGPRGLHGYAQNVLLTSPSVNADGTINLRVYARFDR